MDLCKDLSEAVGFLLWLLLIWVILVHVEVYNYVIWAFGWLLDWFPMRLFLFSPTWNKLEINLPGTSTGISLSITYALATWRIPISLTELALIIAAPSPCQKGISWLGCRRKGWLNLRRILVVSLLHVALLDSLVLLEHVNLFSHGADHLLVGWLYCVQLGYHVGDLRGHWGCTIFDVLKAFYYLGVLVPNLAHLWSELVLVTIICLSAIWLLTRIWGAWNINWWVPVEVLQGLELL